MNIKPQLDDLRLFCVVARNRSFAETSRELGVSKAVVSKRIALLESAVQEKLFHRTTRNVSLTAQGEIVQQWAQRILEDVDLMGEAISREKGFCRVNVASMPCGVSFPGCTSPGRN